MKFRELLLSEFRDHFRIDKPKRKKTKKNPPHKTFKLLALNEADCPFDNGYPDSYFKAIAKDSKNKDYQTVDGLLEYVQDTCGVGNQLWEDNFGRYQFHYTKRTKHSSLEEIERKQLRALRWIYLRVELGIIYYT